MSQVPIFTIGYGARQIEEFIALLQAHQIAYLIDIRTKPSSGYKPEFSQAALEQRLRASGIRYVFMGDALGGRPDDPACYVDGKVDYALVAQKPIYHQGIARLKAAWEQQLPVVLMCSEGKPEMCHRSKLIAPTLAAEGIEVVHIDEQGRLISQLDVTLRLQKGQPSLFGDAFLPHTSRKRYRKEEEDGH